MSRILKTPQDGVISQPSDTERQPRSESQESHVKPPPFDQVEKSAARLDWGNILSTLVLMVTIIVVVTSATWSLSGRLAALETKVEVIAEEVKANGEKIEVLGEKAEADTQHLVRLDEQLASQDQRLKRMEQFLDEMRSIRRAP